MALGRREEVIGFIDFWTAGTGIPAKSLCCWLGIRASKLSVWRTRTGMPNAHAPFVPREDCLTNDEVKAIVDCYREHLFDGYRRCTYMMMDVDVAVASPSTVYSVLRRAGVMRPRRPGRGCKGTGFRRPDAPHRRWHTDITHAKVNGVPANLCSTLDGYSRFILTHRLSKDGKALGNVTAARSFALCYGEDILEKLGIGEIAPSHQGSLQPPRAFNPSEKCAAQDGRENCVPKGGDFAESNATPDLGRTARKKTCGIECTTCGNKRTLFSPQGAFTPAKVR